MTSTSNEQWQLPGAVKQQLRARGVTNFWPAREDGRACALAVDRTGLVIFSGDGGEQFVAWEDVRDIAAIGATTLRIDHDDLTRTLELRNPGALRAIAQHVPSAMRGRFQLTPTPSTGGGRTAVAAEDPPSTMSVIWALLGVGFLVHAIGLVVVSDSTGNLVDQADGGVILGWLLVSAGGMAVLIALVALGTMLGIRAARGEAGR